MTNAYYNHVNGLPASQTKALASQVRSELDGLAGGFDLLPSPAALFGGSANYAADTGSVNALAIAINAKIVSLTDGLAFSVRAANTNTAATTLAPGSLSVTALVRTDGTDLQAGDIVAGQIILVAYSSAMGKFQLLASGAAVSATAAAASATAAAASAASATNSANVAGTSTSSNAVPATVTGSKSFTYVEAARTVAVGMLIMCADTAAPSTNYIVIQVTAWNSGTQVVTGDVAAVKGSGTKTAWTLTLTGAPAKINSFASTAQTITSAGSLTIAHALGAVPNNVQGFLTCVTGENGYTAGNILCVALGTASDSGTDGYGVSIVIDATNLNVRYGSQTTVFRIPNKTTGAAAVATNANWTFSLKASV